MLVRLFFLEGRRSHSVFDNSKLIFFGRTKKSFRVRICRQNRKKSSVWTRFGIGFGYSVFFGPNKLGSVSMMFGS